MQWIGVILFLISFGCVVGPIGAVVVMYHDNLVQVVVPQEISDILSGNSTIINTQYNNQNGNNNTGDSGFLAPVYVSSSYDSSTRTVTVTVNYTNTFGINLTLKELSGTVVCTEHNYVLGTIGLAQPVELPADQTTQITVTGSWTQDAEDHITTLHPGATSINVNLNNLTINVNDITIQQSEPVSIGNVPITP
jgi:hypothetical protein